MIYQIEVSNPSAYLKEFQTFSNKISKVGLRDNSYGLAIPIVGKNSEFSHFFGKDFRY